MYMVKKYQRQKCQYGITEDCRNGRFSNNPRARDARLGKRR